MAREGRFDLSFAIWQPFRAGGSGQRLSRSPEELVVVRAGDRASARSRRAAQRRGRAASQDGRNGAGDHATDNRLDGDAAPAEMDDEPTVSVAEAARLLGRDRTRIYALLRSGDLVAVSATDDDAPGPVRIDY
jgi:hypothetical protein